jgi:hypothetical protein
VKAGIGLVGALLVLALPATVQAQDTYTVHHCQAPGGGPGSVDGLSAISGAAGLGFACPASGVGSGPPIGNFAHFGAWGIRYRVPPDTALASFTLYRTVAVQPPWNYTLFRDDSTAPENLVETCWTVGGGPCRGVGDGRVSNASRVARTTPDTGGLLLYVDCNPGPCGPGGSSRVTLHRLDAELSDRLDPVLVGTPSGDLLEPQRAVAGTRSIAFSATDRGGGIYRATIEVDGAPAVTQVVDPNGGRCREPFTAPVPCRLTASGSIALDTATLADGVHSVRLVVTDATGTNAVAYGPVEITTRNQSPSCDPAVTRAVTPVSARFRGTRRARITRERGRGARIRGTVAGAGAGTPVFLIARAVRRGARARVAARALTASDGSYRLRVPRGPSRRLRVGYRVRSTDPLLACSRTLRVNTPARLTLRARPRSVPAGGRVRLSGRLLGGKVPARGKTVELQAFERGRWRTFETARARRGRRFVARYRFSGSAAGRTFPMRARVRPDALYPFSTGHSRVVRVRVF